MRKEFLVALCVIGLCLWVVTAAYAGPATWHILTNSAIKKHSAGADGLIGTTDDGTAEKCNFSDAKNCEVVGDPTVGSYSYAKISPVQASSCVVGGASCTANSQCPFATDCMDCGGGTATEWSFFGVVAGQTKGAGTFGTCATTDGNFKYLAMDIGASESSPDTGAGCLTLRQSISGTPCGAGDFSSSLKLDLFVAATSSPFTACQVQATVLGPIPANLNGRVYAGGVTIPTGDPCGYSTGQVNTMMTQAGVTSSGKYLMVSCTPGGVQTLPTLGTPCLSGATFKSVVVAYSLTEAGCSDACPSGGCAGGTAEEVQ